MHQSRTAYFVIVVITIFTGLLSRHFNGIPLFIGDVLWALMVYFIMRFLLIAKPVKVAAVASLLFSYAIEFSQLYKAPWINELRQTIFGKLVLGQGFLWTDLLCYTAGVLTGILIDALWRKKASFS